MTNISLTETLAANSLEHKLEAQIKAALDASDEEEKGEKTEELSQTDNDTERLV